MPFTKLGEDKQKLKMPSHDAINIGIKLLEFLKYTVIASPRTGHEEFDPLLMNAPDLYAEGNGRGLAINVKSFADEFEINFDDIEDLSSAAWALNAFSEEHGDDSISTVEPAVLLVGATENPTIALHQRRGDLRVLKLTKEQADSLQDASKPEDVTEILTILTEQFETPLRGVAIK